VRILALADENLRVKLNTYIQNMAQDVERKQASLNAANT
jgi:phosphoribosylcarboxyaminoimidazole (NCAIR) mutase